MKFHSLILVASTFVISSAFTSSPPRRSSYHQSSSSSSSCPKKTTRLFAEKENSPADALLKMVDEISNSKSSDEKRERMAQLEQALTLLVEGKKDPRPPSIPPPLESIRLVESINEADEYAVKKAEEALRQLRQRLREEEELLRQAELALQRSLEEEETLRRAEQVLQQSRAATEARKAEAIRRTEASADKARQLQEQAKKLAAEAQQNLTKRLPRGTIALGRPTISLESFFGGKTDSDKSGNGNSEEKDKPPANTAPDGMPILYNWVQYIDGSISGCIKGSRNFKDGSNISTSPISETAKGGRIVTTASGSKYFLEPYESKEKVDSTKDSESQKAKEAERIQKDEEERQRRVREANVVAEQKLKDAEADREAVKAAREIRRKEEEEQNAAVAKIRDMRSASANSATKMASAPAGVPSILSWTQTDDGRISGQVYGSLNADDGDYIETSPLRDGPVGNGCVVETISGSRYFLSPDTAAKATNVFNAFKDLALSRGGTITISKEKQTENALEKLSQGKPRSTFSLMDLGFGLGSNSQNSIFGAKNDAKAPEGVPTLSRWSVNEDGTITGVIRGSPSIDDGDFVTTSPIARGKKKKFETVVTVSGSKYFLL